MSWAVSNSKLLVKCDTVQWRMKDTGANKDESDKMHQILMNNLENSVWFINEQNS